LVLRQTLLLLHPFIPFITEELWSRLGYGAAGTLISGTAQAGTAKSEDASHFVTTLLSAGVKLDRDAIATVEKLKAYASQARALKAEYGRAASRDVVLSSVASKEVTSIIEANRDKLIRVIGAKEIRYVDVQPKGMPAVVTPLGTLSIDLASTVDAAAEKARLAKELDTLAKHIASTEARLSNPAFAGKAPPQVVEGAKKQLADLLAKKVEIDRLINAL
jgi:valyl-tRNA synthetase